MPIHFPAERTISSLRAEMFEQKLNVKELAKRTGYSSSAMARRMSGEVPLTLDDIQKIAGGLGLSVSLTLDSCNDRAAA